MRSRRISKAFSTSSNLQTLDQSASALAMRHGLHADGLENISEQSQSRLNLVWGVFCQGGAPRVLSIFCAGLFFASPGSRSRSCRAVSAGARFLQGISLVRSAPQAFPRPDRGALMPARAEAVKDGA